MRHALIISIAAIASVLPSSVARAGDPDHDRTPLAQCDDLPSSAAIEVFSSVQALAVCREMVRILDSATISDLRSFSRVAFMLSVKGYGQGDYASIVREIVEIVRLRGLANDESSWSATNDLIWRLWIVEKGLISPRTMREFLASAGPDIARTITDHALLETMITLAVAHKNGIDLDEPK
jgi:hypothetical protein